MTITRKHTTTCYRKRCAALGAATAAAAAAMLLPAGGAVTAQAQQCPASTNATAPSQITDTEQADILRLANGARAEASSSIPSLTWDSTLADEAQGWANTLAPVTDNGVFLCHTPGIFSTEGETIALAYSVPEGVQAWLNEKSNYSYPTPFSLTQPAVYGHYTQMIWKDTTRIGCGKATPGTSSYILLVCRYAPPGNIVGQLPY
jgi:pathogenesis-related protein 1